MGIEPTSEAWEVLNFPIPFSSQRVMLRHKCQSIVRLLKRILFGQIAKFELSPEQCFGSHGERCSANRLRGHTNHLPSVGRVGQLATASRKLRRQASRVLALYPMIYQTI
jgi:hypothetical protein